MNLLIGLILIIKNKSLDESFFVILLFLTVLVIFYLVELFLSRWYQLTDNEKKKLVTFLEFKNNFLKILESINLVFGDLTKPSNFFSFSSNNKNTTQKKCVRNDKNDNIKVLNKNWLFETSQKNYKSIKKEYNELDLFK